MTLSSDAEVFRACATQRRVFADLIESLNSEQLDSPSLCARWSNREVAGHLASAVSVSFGRFLVVVLRNLGNLNRANVSQAARFAGLPPAELVELIRKNADLPIKPPKIGARGPMSDVLIHTGDVAIPLGLPFEPDLVAVECAMDFLYPSAPGFSPSSRLRGLAFEPTDVEQSRGIGERISGRAADLMMAMAGRRAVLDRLSGPGVATLRTRLRAQ